MTGNTRANKLSHFLKQVGGGGKYSAERQPWGSRRFISPGRVPPSTGPRPAPPNPVEESFLQETPLQEKQRQNLGQETWREVRSGPPNPSSGDSGRRLAVNLGPDKTPVQTAFASLQTLRPTAAGKLPVGQPDSESSGSYLCSYTPHCLRMAAESHLGDKDLERPVLQPSRAETPSRRPSLRFLTEFYTEYLAKSLLSNTTCVAK